MITALIIVGEKVQPMIVNASHLKILIILTSVVNMSTFKVLSNNDWEKFEKIISDQKKPVNIYQKIFHPTLQDVIDGYENQIKRKREEIALIEDRILQLKHQQKPDNY